MYFLVALILVMSIFLYLIFPSLRKHEYRNIMKNQLIAHRGFHNKEKGVPENSLGAFAEAVARGFAIETDIHITADGEVVAFHDRTLERMCGVNLEIEKLTLNELKKYRLDETDEQIPTLKQVLQLVDAKVPLVIEFKSDGKTCDKLCLAADKILSGYKGVYVVKSFYPPVIAWYKKNNKSVCRGILGSVYENKNSLAQYISPFLLNFKTRPDFISYDFKHKNRFMFTLQKLLGAMTFGWTFRSEKQLEECKKDFGSYIFENFNPKEVK